MFRSESTDEIELSLFTTFPECVKDHRPFDRIPKLETDDDMAASAAQLILDPDIIEENKFRMRKKQNISEIISENIK